MIRIRKSRRQSVCSECGRLVILGELIAETATGWAHIHHITDRLREEHSRQEPSA